MSDLFEEPQGQGGNAHEFSVSEISGAIKRVIEGEFGHVRVRGEVGRTMHARSGHLYFDLKDDRAVISAVSWKGQVARLAVMPEEGMEVVATGRLTTFPGQSRYQLIVEAVEPAGEGALMAMLEKRKKMLAAEGLFDAARKKELPYLPRVIGVVTSPSGAVIRDILHRLRDRFPTHVLIWPVAVQGKDCAPQVARAIAGFNALAHGGAIPRPDLLIVARGGGSVEDLWGFNEEIVARAAAASDIPLISAVGHETDTTLIDYVADRRAPTPTAAAEIAVPVRIELMGWAQEQGARLTNALTQQVRSRRQRLEDLGRALPRADALTQSARQQLDRATERLPMMLRRVVQDGRARLARSGAPLRPSILRGQLRDRRRALDQAGRGLAPHYVLRQIGDQSEKLDRLGRELTTGFERRLDEARQRLTALARLNETLSYRATLGRGYAVIHGADHVVTRRAEAAELSELTIEFVDGKLDVAPAEPPAPRRKPRAKPPGQGSLF